MNKLISSSATFSLLFAMSLSFSGCLKTRAQLKDDSDNRGEASRPGPAQPVQDVHPQGQYVLDEIKDEITRLTGRIEDLERSQRESSSHPRGVDKEELRKLEERISEKISLLEKTQTELQ